MRLMEKDSRTYNTVNNSLTGALLQIVTALFAVLYRTILIRVLGVEYLGINGLFSNILNLLSLSELGFNIAIAYRMYEPANSNDYDRLSSLVLFFERVYQIVALVILGVGICLIPFLEFLIKDYSEVPSEINIYIIYIIMLVQSASSYLFTSRQVIIQAYQKEYYNNIFQMCNVIIKYSIQIIILVILRKYYILLIAGIGIGIIFNVIYYIFISKKYSYIFSKKLKICEAEKKQIFNEVKALLMHKIGGVVLSSTDNLVISSILGISTVGIYSNYTVIVTMISTVISRIFGGTTASIGNLNVSESRESSYRTFIGLNLLTLWVVSYCSISLFCLLNPFVELWLGRDYLLSMGEVWTITTAFYVMFSRYVNTVYVNACGIYHLDRYRPIFEALINLVISIALAKLIGLKGVFIGTIISEMLTAWWREPFLLYRNIFGESYKMKEYWKLSLFMGGMTMLFDGVCLFVCSLFPMGWMWFFIKCFLCLFIINITYYLIFRTRDEFYIISNLVKKIALKLKK